MNEYGGKRWKTFDLQVSVSRDSPSFCKTSALKSKNQPRKGISRSTCCCSCGHELYKYSFAPRLKKCIHVCMKPYESVCACLIYVLECGHPLLSQLPYSPELHLRSWTSHLTRGIAPEKCWLEDCFPMGRVHFRILKSNCWYHIWLYSVLDDALGQAVRRGEDQS